MDDFRSQIFRCAAEGVGFAIADLLCESKVHELDMAVGIEEDILGLEVAVGNSVDIVQKFDCHCDFGGVES